MLDNHDTPAETPQQGADTAEQAADAKAPAKKAAARKTAARATAAKTTPRKTATAPRKTTARKTTAKAAAAEEPAADAAAPAATETPAPTETPEPDTAAKTTARKTPAKKTAVKKSTAPRKATAKKAAGEQPEQPAEPAAEAPQGDDSPAAPQTMLLFQPPEAAQAPPARKPRKKATPQPAEEPAEAPAADTAAEPAPAAADHETTDDTGDEAGEAGEGGARRRRRRGGRRRRKSGGEGDGAETGQAEAEEKDDQAAGSGPASDDQEDAESSSSTRRRRRRRRAGENGGDTDDDPHHTVTRVRKGRSAEDQITAVTGSTRLEAKKQRRREGREAGRRRAPIVSEAEFLARRESVDRVMAIRQRDDLTQIAVLEDKVLVEHYVARESQTSLIGNVYLGRVQNVLPSMEAAFIDIGKGRNAVLYAGEVNWSALGHQDGQPRKIESVLSSGQSVLVQVTKDPVGHKGARLTSQVSLAGRFLVYVPDGTNSGISRKLPDTERNRLKALLKEIVPDGAGVIVRTAAEGASEEELTRDVERLRARWEDIEKKARGSAPQLLYGEPDLMLKVVRDLFTEDFSKLVVQGDDAWDTVQGYVSHVAPDLGERLENYDDSRADLFTTYRIEEQIHKGLDRKVWLPSGGSLIIDRTEAMTVVDVNTGKFTGSGGNLEETVTKNNLEAAEEIVRQLRLRDIGGIIVVDFIDMVLESNRDLVLRRLVECLGRDRTRHQVAEVTSLGLIQMTRKRIGTGLLEAFSETCEHCGGRGLIVADAPIEPKKGDDDSRRSSRRSRRGRGDANGPQDGGNGGKLGPSPKDVAAMARPAPKPEDEVPAKQDEVPAKQDEVPAKQDEVPAKQDEAPAQQDEAPVQQDEAAAKQDEAPATEPEPRPEPVADTPATKRPSRARAKRAAGAPEPAPAAAPTEPVTEPAAPAEPAPAPAEPAPPKVVTRTRRRSASRPAGPPSGSTPAAGPAAEPAAESTSRSEASSLAEGPAVVGTIGAPPIDGTVEPGTSDAEPAAPPVEHVPVKKKGSRKR